jgi:hypothetical protein
MYLIVKINADPTQNSVDADLSGTLRIKDKGKPTLGLRKRNIQSSALGM